MVNNSILELKNLKRSYTDLPVLNGVNLQLNAGELVALVGRSGAGKSTLLQIAGLLDAPTSGQVLLQGQDITTLNETNRTNMRAQAIGFVYQFHHLLPEFTALENVMLPQLAIDVPVAQAKARAQELLQKVGLKNRVQHLPSELSGGEQQRVAIARALANRPKLILADEPTGNLDYHTTDAVFDLLLQVVRQEGAAALIATHNPELAKQMDRQLILDQGLIVAA
jgi:lipoprotein-releasing system ATP-binding protein